jgi:hypothetical protein
MALESGTYVKDLVSTNPPGTDAISQGDDHIRLIKSVLKNSFPSTNSAPIIPDISGVNTGATATQWADFDSLTRRKGELQRPQFSYASASSITISPAIYDLDAKGKTVSWDSTLTVTGLSGTDQWVYIYLDYSAISGTTVTASEVIGSTTAPTWSDSKHGWYNGDDRCIFAVYFSGSSILEFDHDGGNLVLWDSDYSSGTHNSLTPASKTLQIPSFAHRGQCTFYANGTAGPGQFNFYWRDTGGSGSHLIARTEDDEAEFTVNAVPVYTNTSQQIDVYLTQTGATGGYPTLYIYTTGFYLPRGL